MTSWPAERPREAERVCFFYRLRKGAETEYEARHREVWVEMYDLLGDAGVSDYSVYVRGRTVVSVLKASPTWASVEAVLDRSVVQAEWSRSLGHLFEKVRDGKGGLLYGREVFRYEGLAGVTMPDEQQ